MSMCSIDLICTTDLFYESVRYCNFALPRKELQSVLQDTSNVAKGVLALTLA